MKLTPSKLSVSVDYGTLALQCNTACLSYIILILCLIFVGSSEMRGLLSE